MLLELFLSFGIITFPSHFLFSCIFCFSFEFYLFYVNFLAELWFCFFDLSISETGENDSFYLDFELSLFLDPWEERRCSYFLELLENSCETLAWINYSISWKIPNWSLGSSYYYLILSYYATILAQFLSESKMFLFVSIN